jgi:uncharacterized membrane protein
MAVGNTARSNDDRPGLVARPPARIGAVDVVRAFAALLMVVNHAGFSLLSAGETTSGITGQLVFLGGFAPVLFFFTTGWGVGLQARNPQPAAELSSVLSKVLLLLSADQFLHWKGGHLWGLDFFGFIGISLLVVSLIARVPRPLAAAAALIVSVLALRFVIGPSLRTIESDAVLLHWAAGDVGIPGSSYPASPWLVYPLLGFMVGWVYRTSPRALFAGMALLGLAGLGSVVYSEATGAEYFRWGMVNAAYFGLSLLVLSAFVAISEIWVRTSPRSSRFFQMGGVASFAIVPIHYAVIALMWAAGVGPVNAPTFWVWAPPLLIVCIYLARVAERLLARRSFSGAWEGWCAAAVVAAAAVTLMTGLRPLAATLAASAGQLGVVALFAWRVNLFRSRAKPASRTLSA